MPALNLVRYPRYFINVSLPYRLIDLVPDKPVIGKVTNNSVEVSWSIPPISYCLQQRVEKEGPEFKAVYE